MTEIYKRLEINNAEIASLWRVDGYIKNGLGSDKHHCGAVIGCCDPIPGVFVSPAADPAPWYSATVPESANVLGFIIDDVDVMADERRITADVVRGHYVGPRRLDGVRVGGSVWVIATTAEATAYGAEWLRARLAGSEFAPDNEWKVWNSCNASGERTLCNVALTAWDDSTPERFADVGRQITFEARSERPFWWETQRTTTFSLTNLTANGQICLPCSTLDCDTCIPCGYVAPVEPVTSTDPCYCPPMAPRRVAQLITLDAADRAMDLRVTVTAQPGEDLDALAVRILPDTGNSDSPASMPDLYSCASPTAAFAIGQLPAGSTLVADGCDQSFTVTCADGSVVDGTTWVARHPGEPFGIPFVTEDWDTGGNRNFWFVADFPPDTGAPLQIDVTVLPRAVPS